MTRTVAVVQARMSSRRCPGKIARDFGGAPILQRVIERVRMASAIDAVVVATSERPDDDRTAEIAEACDTSVFRGSLEDVRGRFLAVAERERADVLVRVTADNPYTEPSFIDELVRAKLRAPQTAYLAHDFALAVHGTPSECVDVGALRRAAAADPDDPENREHVTPALRHRADAVSLAPAPELCDSLLSLSVDEVEHYEAVRRVFERYGNAANVLAEIVADHRSGALDPTGLRR